ncbi:DUF418 domain-containing protein [Nocardia farcinica]|uniref:DUF418 domain-containing protein n=1 Tax=Nocardia farcinica TaxID=37329 RepID=UPI0011C06A0A|nr:DUF418 domain-containing protein [Nocardia farcinica]
MAGQDAPGAVRREFEALCGVAVCGVLVPGIWRAVDMRDTDPSGERLDGVRQVLAVSLDGRFLAMLAFLFGLGCARAMDAAVRRGQRPHAVLLRGLLVLSVLGAIELWYRPGAVLLPLAVAGAVVLAPASLLPRGAVLALGLGVTVAVALTLGGDLAPVPGLLLLGLAAQRYRLLERAVERPAWLVAVFLLAVPAAVATAVWQWRTPYLELWSSPSGPVAALAGALAYLTGLLLLLRTETGALLTELLAPLGRMALTASLSATPLILLAEPQLRLTDSTRYGAVVVLAAGVLAGQIFCSHLWLRWLCDGPVEWVTRSVARWAPAPVLRRRESATAPLGLPRR